MGRSRSKAQKRSNANAKESSDVNVKTFEVGSPRAGPPSPAKARAEKLRAKLVTSEMNPILDFILTIVIMCISPFMIFWVRIQYFLLFLDISMVLRRLWLLHSKFSILMSFNEYIAY
jgi:hypothetical protein